METRARRLTTNAGEGPGVPPTSAAGTKQLISNVSPGDNTESVAMHLSVHDNTTITTSAHVSRI